MSIGLWTDAAGWKKRGELGAHRDGELRYRNAVSLAGVGAQNPGPPALVTIATRSPRGTGWALSREVTASISCSVSVRITPAWLNSASTVTSEAASSAPVWEEVARAPAAERPLLTAIKGFRRANRAGDAAELAGVAKRFQVEQRHVCALILLPVAHKVVAGEVCLVADRHERGETDPVAPRGLDDRDPEPTALRHEAHAARLCGVGSEGCVEGDVRSCVQDAKAIWSDEPHARVAADCEQLSLAVGALAAQLREPRRDDEQARVRRPRALSRDRHDLLCRHRHHGQVDRL